MVDSEWWRAVSDATKQALELQTSILRRRTGEQRLADAMEMSDLTRDLCLARLRGQHPDWSQDDLTRELMRCFLGSDAPPRSPS